MDAATGATNGVTTIRARDTRDVGEATRSTGTVIALWSLRG